MCMGVEGILLSSHVVGSVIDMHDFVLINLILNEGDGCTLGFRERNLIEVVFLV